MINYDDEDIYDEFPGLEVCYMSLCIKSRYRLPDGREISLCEIVNKRFLKEHQEWEQID